MNFEPPTLVVATLAVKFLGSFEFKQVIVFTLIVMLERN